MECNLTLNDVYEAMQIYMVACKLVYVSPMINPVEISRENLKSCIQHIHPRTVMDHISERKVVMALK